MSYESSRSTRVASIAAGFLVVGSFIVYGERNAIKESYFNAVLAGCGDMHGIVAVHWEQMPAFDADVRDFRARNDNEAATIHCVVRWAGLMLDYSKETDNSIPPFHGEALETVVSGQNLAVEPPLRFFDASYIEYVAPAPIRSTAHN